ncbi:hypothetical protein ON010_g17393 [Phytophthora cinnamomi]|nr:hypothetical protein ON010_g17393 [Phytophthora cinnamomi]
MLEEGIAEEYNSGGQREGAEGRGLGGGRMPGGACVLAVKRRSEDWWFLGPLLFRPSRRGARLPPECRRRALGLVDPSQFSLAPSDQEANVDPVRGSQSEPTGAIGGQASLKWFGDLWDQAAAGVADPRLGPHRSSRQEPPKGLQAREHTVALSTRSERRVILGSRTGSGILGFLTWDSMIRVCYFWKARHHNYSGIAVTPEGVSAYIKPTPASLPAEDSAEVDIMKS